VENLGNLTEKVEAAFRRAAVKVIERARQTGTPVIFWENGRIVQRSAEEMERELSENLGKSPIESG
jgi:hypothetical protein